MSGNLIGESVFEKKKQSFVSMMQLLVKELLRRIENWYLAISM